MSGGQPFRRVAVIDAGTVALYWADQDDSLFEIPWPAMWTLRMPTLSEIEQAGYEVVVA